MATFYDRVRGFLGVRDRVKPMTEQGTGGFAVYGGYIVKPEQNIDLLGQNRWRTASDLLANISIIAASLRYNLNLISRPSWKFDPPSDKAEAKAVAEFFDSMFDDIEGGWTRIVRRSGMYRYHGFGANEWLAKRRDDGKIGLRSIESRPQHTIEKWDIDEAGSILGLVQRDPQDGHERYLPRGKLLYFVDDTLTDSPDGMGWFRHLVEPANRLKAYLQVEGFGFERDLAGIPVGRMPIEEINQLVADGKLTQENAASMRQGLIDFVTMRRKQSGTGLVLDSKPYLSKSDTGQTVSGAPQWGIELISGTQNSIEELGAAIERLEYEMALIMGTESMLVGRGGQGSRALSEDKSRNLYLTANATLEDMAEAVQLDIVQTFGKLNGIPDKLLPTAKVEDVAFKDAETIARTLADMAAAGAVLAPDDPAINDLRNLLGISEAELMDIAMVNAVQGRPDPTKPSPDKELDDARARDALANDNEQREIDREQQAKQPQPKPGQPARKAEPRTLYVQRRLLNSAKLIKWAKANGFTTTIPAEDLHVTICYSKRPIDWMSVSEDWTGDMDGRLRIAPGGPRLLEKFGEAVVLLFKDDGLEWRHAQFISAGASFDHAKYQPHVSISWQAPEDLDIAAITPYDGELIFGPEIFEELDENWKDGLTEKFNPDQPRAPKGTDNGGQWISRGGGLAQNEDDGAEHTITVMRVGGPEPSGLEGRNAGNTKGVANHLVNEDDWESPNNGNPLSHIHVYEVKHRGELGKYQELIRGRPRGPEAGDAVVGVRESKWGAQQYSFPAGAKFEERHIGSIPVAEVRQYLIDTHVDNYRGNFDDNGGARTAEAIDAVAARIVGKAYNPNQPRDPKGTRTGGRWTAAGAGVGHEEPAPIDPSVVRMNDEEMRKLKDGQRGKTIEELHAMAVENQAALRKVGQNIAAETGLEFVEAPNGGYKSLSGAKEKIARKGYDGPHHMTDLSRATFVVDNPADAHAAVNSLAKEFPGGVFDEGWKRERNSGYLDRKLLVRFPNNGVAEIQVIPRGMYQQKFHNGGHELYELTRMPSTPRGQAMLLTEVMRAKYTGAIEGTDFMDVGG